MNTMRSLMKAYIIIGFLSLFGLLSIAADAPSSDALIQQQIVGTWHLNWIAMQCTTTISTNGDYVANWTDSLRTREEGTIEIRNGLMIDTLKKTSGNNQPVPMPHVSTNLIVRLTDHELIFQPQNGSRQIMWERGKQ